MTRKKVQQAREWELRMLCFIGGQMSMLATAVCEQQGAITHEQAEQATLQYVAMTQQLMGDILAEDKPNDKNDGPRVKIH